MHYANSLERRLHKLSDLFVFLSLSPDERAADPRGVAANVLYVVSSSSSRAVPREVSNCKCLAVATQNFKASRRFMVLLALRRPLRPRCVPERSALFFHFVITQLAYNTDDDDDDDHAAGPNLHSRPTFHAARRRRLLTSKIYIYIFFLFSFFSRCKVFSHSTRTPQVLLAPCAAAPGKASLKITVAERWVRLDEISETEA